MRKMQLLVLSLFVAGTVAAQQQNAAAETTSGSATKVIPKKQMVKFVEEAAAYVRLAGKEEALKEFSDPKGKFVHADGELYIYAHSCPN